MSSLELGRWYAVEVKKRYEQVSEDALKARGYEIFYPTVSRKRTLSDRVRHVQEPVFPGYVFCRPRESAHRILDATGVVRIVGFGGKPAPVPDSEIRSLQVIFGAGVPTYECSYMASGERIRIRNGPLKDVQGIFVRHVSSTKVAVSVELLQRSLLVDVAAGDVQLI